MSVGRMGLVQAGSPDKQCPTLAELTADATATASQLAKGATAYVQGEKITGIMPTTIDVAAAGIKLGNSTFEKVPSYFDFSTVIDASSMFTDSKIVTFEGVNFKLAKNAYGLFVRNYALTTFNNIFLSLTTASLMFYACNLLATVEGIDFSNISNTISMFYRCSSLTSFQNTSTISCSLSFADSPLLNPSDAESSILGMLADLTGKTSQTITFNTALQSSISESAIQAATDKNWVVNFADSM